MYKYEMTGLVLLTINSKKENYSTTADKYSAIPPNIPLLITEAYLSSRDIDVKIMDTETYPKSMKQIIQDLNDINPKVVGIVCSGSNPSASTMSMVGAGNFFNELKNSKYDFLTFVSGGHPTVLPERTLHELSTDFVVLGEGYQAIEEIISFAEGKIEKNKISSVAYIDNDKFVKNEINELIKDIGTLPRINWHKVNTQDYRAHNWHCFGDSIDNRSPYAIIWTNQGCPYPCNFCSINNVFGKRSYRLREMKDVIAEIDILYNKFNIRNLKILDELFVFKNPRLDEFCDLLEERNYNLNMWCFARTDTVTPEILKRLKKVGVNWIAYGFESFDGAILEATRKKSKANVLDTIKWTKDADINICADVIAGLWQDNEKTINMTRDFMLENEFEWVNIYPAFAYPGTPLYDEYINKSIISEPQNWDIYGLYSKKCNPCPTKHLSSSQVLKLRDQGFHEYYHNEKILRMIERKFGKETLNHVVEMVKTPLERDIFDEKSKLIIPSGGFVGQGISTPKPKYNSLVV
jgi:radical SAM superfamily enzyme YgiQ (UPF0313 family)